METKMFDVQELPENEQRSIQGGWILWVIGTLIYLYDNREDLIKGFKEGYKVARDTEIKFLPL